MAFKMKGFGGFTSSPAKQKSKEDLKKKPNPTVKAKKRNTYNEKEEQVIENMSNAKDNNFSTWAHSEAKRKVANKDLTKSEMAGAEHKYEQRKKQSQEKLEDMAGKGKGSNRKVMKDGKKNNATHKGKVIKGNWEPHQFRKK